MPRLLVKKKAQSMCDALACRGTAPCQQPDTETGRGTAHPTSRRQQAAPGHTHPPSCAESLHGAFETRKEREGAFIDRTESSPRRLKGMSDGRGAGDGEPPRTWPAYRLLLLLRREHLGGLRVRKSKRIVLSQILESRVVSGNQQWQRQDARMGPQSAPVHMRGQHCRCGPAVTPVVRRQGMYKSCADWRLPRTQAGQAGGAYERQAQE